MFFFIKTGKRTPWYFDQPTFVIDGWPTRSASNRQTTFAETTIKTSSSFAKKTSNVDLPVLYKTYVRPILEFGNIVLEPNLGQSKTLERIQKFILRDIEHDFDKDYISLLRSYEIDSLNCRREKRILRLILNIRNATRQASSSISKQLVFKYGGIVNRRGIELLQPIVNFKRFQTFSQFAPKIFNQLPNTIRSNYNLTDCYRLIEEFYN